MENDQVTKAKERYRTICNFVNDKCVGYVLKLCKEDDKRRADANEFCKKCLEKEAIYGFSEILEIAKAHEECIPPDLGALLTICEKVLLWMPHALSEEDYDDLCRQTLQVVEVLTGRCKVLGEKFLADAKRSLIYRSNNLIYRHIMSKR